MQKFYSQSRPVDQFKVNARKVKDESESESGVAKKRQKTVRSDEEAVIVDVLSKNEQYDEEALKEGGWRKDWGRSRSVPPSPRSSFQTCIPWLSRAEQLDDITFEHRSFDAYQVAMPKFSVGNSTQGTLKTRFFAPLQWLGSCVPVSTDGDKVSGEAKLGTKNTAFWTHKNWPEGCKPEPVPLGDSKTVDMSGMNYRRHDVEFEDVTFNASWTSLSSEPSDQGKRIGGDGNDMEFSCKPVGDSFGADIIDTVDDQKDECDIMEIGGTADGGTHPANNVDILKDQSNEQYLTCSHCSSAFISQFSLTRHIQTIHKPTRRDHVCNACHLAFATQTGVDRHWNVSHADDLIDNVQDGFSGDIEPDAAARMTRLEMMTIEHGRVKFDPLHFLIVQSFEAGLRGVWGDDFQPL